MIIKLTTLLIMAFFLVSCEKIVLMTTPAKKPILQISPLANQAEENFWTALHHGQYQNIPDVIHFLTAAYLENPYNPKLAAHLGFAHIWKITERQRLKTNDPIIVNEIILAKKYFADAFELNPHDARYLGFLGDSILIEGKIFHSKRNEVRGYFTLKEAIRMWPAFNYFTAGYPMSTLNPHTTKFKEGLNWQWKTLDICAGKKIDRNNPDYRPYLSRETQQGSLRVCWNSWIAPHNFEGFFLNMGDMLVKAGHWHQAIKIYNNAKLSKDYASWPYRDMLEKRIAHAKENVSHFQKSTYHTAHDTILFNSGRGCMVCHERG